MSGWVIFIIVIALGTIISGILLLKQSARKFNLTEQQMKDIKDRNAELEKQEQDEQN